MKTRVKFSRSVTKFFGYPMRFIFLGRAEPWHPPPSSQSCARPHPLGVSRTRAPDSHHTARPTLARRAQRRRVGPRPRRGLCRFPDLHRELTRFVTTRPRATSMRGKYRLREMSGEKNDQFNMLEALAEHAPDVFRHELVANHLDTTTTSLLWQVSKS